MGRHKDPLTAYRMRALKGGRDGSIIYAVTYPRGKSINDKRSSNVAFWGYLVDGIRFEPMLRFHLLPDEEKRKYIFPPKWDISKAFETVCAKKKTGVIHEGEDRIRIYGDALLLGRMGERYGVYDDFDGVFGKEIANKIISIAYDLILTDKTVSHFESVFRVRWFPCTDGMSESSG